jgi:hypothetical protein
MAETGTDERDETRDTDMSDAITARTLKETSVTEVPPTVETKEGETKFMIGIERAFGSKQ